MFYNLRPSAATHGTIDFALNTALDAGLIDATIPVPHYFGDNINLPTCVACTRYATSAPETTRPRLQSHASVAVRGSRGAFELVPTKNSVHTAAERSTLDPKVFDAQIQASGNVNCRRRR